MESSPIFVPGSGYVPDAPSATTTLANTQGASEDGISFGDVLDAINPLQHLPIVSTIYREVTGAEIKTLPNLIGGAIFGGIFGLIGAAVESVVKEASGATIGHHLLAAVGLADDDDKKTEVTVTDMATGQVVPETASDEIIVPGAGALSLAALKTTSIMLDEATGQPADFTSERNALQQMAAQRPLAQPAVAAAQAAANQTAPAAPNQAAQPTEFFRSLQRANFSHQPERPLQTLSTIETSAARSARSKTTAAGATANDAVQVEPAVAAPANVGAPTSILPQAQAGSLQAPSVAQAQAALQTNPESFNANMMAALEKYQALRGASTAAQVSITQ
jgi:hypothetical protein